MTSATPTSSPAAPTGPGFRVERIGAERRLEAARRLVGHASGAGEGAERFLEAAARHRIDLTNFWGSIGPEGAVREVALGVIGPGRAAMVFTSSPARRPEEPELGAVLEQLCQSLSGVALAQALLEIRERSARSAFLGAGFRSVGTLAYMRRPVDPTPGAPLDAPSLPSGAMIRPYQAGDDPALLEALEESYVETLDCPELCGLRDTRDVLESHRATGSHDPATWWVIEQRGRLVGAMLFNPSPDQDAIELVYLGLGPALRGQGIGRRVLEFGLSRLAGRPQSSITCAVDERNIPARKLYAGLGFSDVARRLAFVRPLPMGDARPAVRG